MKHDEERGVSIALEKFFFIRTVGTLIRALVSDVLCTWGKRTINQQSPLIWLEMLAIIAQMCTIWKFNIN